MEVKYRNYLLRCCFAALSGKAKELGLSAKRARGFADELLHAYARRTFKTDSLKELTLTQLELCRIWTRSVDLLALTDCRNVAKKS